MPVVLFVPLDSFWNTPWLQRLKPSHGIATGFIYYINKYYACKYGLNSITAGVLSSTSILNVITWIYGGKFRYITGAATTIQLQTIVRQVGKMYVLPSFQKLILFKS